MRRFFLVLAIFLFIPRLAFSDDAIVVTRVMDGDVLQLSNGENVLLIGVDTPESSNSFKLWRDVRRSGQDAKEIMEMGKEASEFTRKLVEGKQVRLEYDVRKKDEYGRTLAYVFIDVFVPSESRNAAGEKFDGSYFEEQFLNAEILRAGYARTMIDPPNVKCLELFLKLEKEAKAQKKGMWRGEAEADRKSLDYHVGVEDATGLGNVRASNAKIGVDYKVSPNSTVGVEASRKINDVQDAAAWGKSTDDGNAAQAKYKLSF